MDWAFRQNVCDCKTFFATALSAKAAGDKLESWLIKIPIDLLILGPLILREMIGRLWIEVDDRYGTAEMPRLWPTKLNKAGKCPTSYFPVK